MSYRLLSSVLIAFILIGVVVSCNSDQDDVVTENEDTVPDTLSNGDDTPSGVPLPVELKKIDPDSILPPEVVPAGEPIFQMAHQNIKSVDEPRLAVLSSSLPHYTIGQDSIKEPEIEEAIGEEKNSGYNEPIPSSKFDFNDAASYNIQGIDVDQGLASSYVMDMIEDRRGNLWFATWTAGVTMYNGRSFIMFDENTGMISNYVWCIYEDAHGKIWFGTDGGGASYYDGHTFMEFSKGSNLDNHLVYDIDGDAEGNVWLATNQGAIMYDGENFIRYGRDQGMGGEDVRSVCISDNGDVWFALFEGGINKFDGEGFTHYSTKEGLVSDNVTRIYEDNEENLWIGTIDSGICMYDGYSFISYQEEMGLPNNRIKSILQDKQGNMWFGTEGGGASMFNRFEFKHFTNQEGMSNNFIWSLLEDSDGNIWFGTFGAGANVYNERSFENYTEYQGLNDHIIRYIIQDYEDNIWFSTNSGGVSRYDGKHFWHYTEEQGLAYNSVRCMLIDQNGDFWFGTNGGGVSRFDGENFYNYWFDNGLSGAIILSMFEDSKGNIWFGTYLGGLTMYDGENFFHLTEEEGLLENTVHSIVEDDDGNLYFGTKTQGVDKYDGETITHITKNEGLVEGSAISMMISRDGALWVGSEGYGLNEITKDTVLAYKMEGGLGHNIFWSIIEDNNGDLWLGTERGLNRFHKDDSLGVIVTNYGKLDGLKGSDFYPNSALLDDQNRLWWGTGKALAMLDLNKYEQNNNAPTIQITDIRLEQTFVDYRKLQDTMASGHQYFIDEAQTIDLDDVEFNDVTAFTNCPEQLELPYYLNHLTFYFSGIDWSAPHKIKYQYKLEGLDDDWRPITDENWAVYSNTPSGEYIFKVRAIGDARVWSEVMSYPVIIHPPWWTTWWAYLLYFIGGLVSLYGFIRYRTAKLLQNKRQLEDTVNERTAEVVQQKEIVERKNQEITSSINYAKRIQTAILPSKSAIDKNLPNSFFFYRPKDIVAGDFYWMEVFEDQLLLAAADCTGHGVPGAMVSVVCHNALNRTVREFNLRNPGDVLNKVRELVIEAFTTADTEIQDGMDISLISLDVKNMEVKYAGANNNLFLVRDGVLEEIMADKMPVGRYLVNKEFKEQRLKIQKGDCLYIFTDGYPDQFGGPLGKKFKYAPFKELLQSLYDKDIKDQEAIVAKTLSDWQGSREQIDDICVIGVRI